MKILKKRIGLDKYFLDRIKISYPMAVAAEPAIARMFFMLDVPIIIYIKGGKEIYRCNSLSKLAKIKQLMSLKRDTFMVNSWQIVGT